MIAGCGRLVSQFGSGMFFRSKAGYVASPLAAAAVEDATHTSRSALRPRDSSGG